MNENNVPASFVLVPREPTPEMQRAAETAYRAWSDAEAPYSEFKHSDSYRAMLAAAPQPASSPVAAEGQAGLPLALEQERQKFQQETRRTSELSVLLQEWIDRHVAEHGPGPWARRCDVCNLVGESQELLGRPINATSPQAPVAAEPVAPLLDSIEVARLWEAFRISDEGQRAVEYLVDRCHLSTIHGALFIAFRAGLFATPTASMADAAEVALVPLGWQFRFIFPTHVSNWKSVLELPMSEMAAGDGFHYETRLVYAATPGPRGENAGGVVEAKPFGWYGESRFHNDFTTNEDTARRWHANGYRLTPLYTHPSPAPDRGLRIAEKGDVS